MSSVTLKLFRIFLSVVFSIVLGIFCPFNPWTLLCRILFGKPPCLEARKRSLSFTSAQMINGGFPKEVNYPQPIVNSVILFEKCPTIPNMVKNANELCYYDRFRSRVQFDKEQAKWICIEVKMDIEKNHIICHKVNNEQELMKLVHSISENDLTNYDKFPPWAMHRIENVGLGSSAIVFRLHHVIADGMSLVGVMGRIFTEVDGSPLKLELPGTRKGKTSEGKPKKPSTLSVIADLLSSVVKVVLLPNTAFDSNLKFTSPDKPNLKQTPHRKICVFPAVKLACIKDIKAKAGVTVNDVMLAATTGALRRYCVSQKDPLVKQGLANQCRALMPFAFPRSSEMLSCPHSGLRNYWAFLSVRLPVDGPTSAERLKTCHADTKIVKESLIAVIQMWMQTNILPIMPEFLARKIALDLFQRHSLVFSNIPGPTRPAVFCGEVVQANIPYFYNLIPQIIINSYAGEVFFSLVLDHDLVKDSDSLAGFYVEELLELTKHLGLSEWNATSILSPKSAGGEFGIIKH